MMHLVASWHTGKIISTITVFNTITFFSLEEY
jgi:hypothetical protein